MGAYTVIVATITMSIGATLWGTSGTDLWEALNSDNVAEYLVAAGTVKLQLKDIMADWYIFQIEEQINPRWSEWLGQLTIEHDEDGITTLQGEIEDSAALYGLIAKFRDLGLTLVALWREDRKQTWIALAT